MSKDKTEMPPEGKTEMRSEDLLSFLTSPFLPHEFGNTSTTKFTSFPPFFTTAGSFTPPHPSDFEDVTVNNSSILAYEGDYLEGIFDLNPDDKSFMFIIEGIILTIVSILGAIGTVMSIGVLVKPAVRESFSALLTGLAVCDTLFLLTSLIMFGLPKLWMWCAVNITNPAAQYTFGLLHIWRVGSTYLTLSVTLERYCAICHPLSKVVIKQKYLLIVSLTFAVLYNIPKFFEIDVLYLDSGEIVTFESSMRQNKYYKQFYVFWSKLIFIELIPYFTIIVLNTLILTKTLKASKFRRRFTDLNGSKPRSGSISLENQLSAKKDGQGRKLSQMTECLPLTNVEGCGSNASSSGAGTNAACAITPIFILENENCAEIRVDLEELQALTNTAETEFNAESFAGIKSAPSSPVSTGKKFEPYGPPGSQNLLNSHGIHPRPPIRPGRSRRNNSLCVNGPPRSASSTNLTADKGVKQRNHSVASFNLSPQDNLFVGRARSVSQTIISKLPISKISVVAKKDKALGATLIGVSLLFLCCQSLKLIPDIYEAFYCEPGSNYCATNNIINTLITLSNLLMCINSAANFLMYMVRGTKFRRAFIRTYTGCCRK